MDRGGGESSGADLTASSGASGTWMESSSIRRRRLSSPSPSAFLTPAFDACAAAIPGSSTSSPVGGAGSLDLDPSLLRYTRSRPHLSSSDSSHLRSTSTRRRLRRLLQLRSSLSSVPSPLARGGCSSVSPLSPIDNLPPARSPPVYMTPVKVEVGENVVVMDGVVVSDSGSTSGMSLFKTEVCHAWDENGICRYGSKCQFAHGKEELRSAGPPMREKSKLPARRSGRSRSPFYSLPSAASGFAVDAAAGGTTRNVAPPAATSTLLTVEADCKQPVIAYLSPSRSVEPQWPPNQAAASGGTAGHIAPPGAVITLLTEEEDCKQLATPLSPPRSAELLVQWPPAEAEDTQITQVLYGPSQRRRLPVFNQFCPDLPEVTPEENVGCHTLWSLVCKSGSRLFQFARLKWK